METLLNILSTLWHFYVVGSVIFTTCFIWGLSGFISDKKKQEKNSAIKYLKENAVAVYIQEVNNCFYVYEFHTNNFIAQGLTKDEMWVNAKKKYPTKDFVIEGPDGEAIVVTNI
jgi:hypothetical protein